MPDQGYPKRSRDGWTWEPRICVYCGEKVTKKDSFGCSWRYEQTWHARCGTGPRRRELSEEEIFRGHGVDL